MGNTLQIVLKRYISTNYLSNIQLILIEKETFTELRQILTDTRQHVYINWIEF
jgi:hypothetical protein